MPYFNFDLVIGEEFKNQGGMILEDIEIAIDKADSLASELCIVRPELRSRGSGILQQSGRNSSCPLNEPPRVRNAPGYFSAARNRAR